MVAKVDGDGKMRKGTWTEEEDAMLAEYVRRHGEGNWNAVQRNSGLRRCGKSCRLRWANHLRPNLKKGSFSPEEERLIVELHARLGNKWARMASMMPGRTDNEIKNYWNTRMKKRRRQRLPLYSYQHPSLSAPTTLTNATSTSTSTAPIPFQFQPYNPPPHSSLPSPLGFKRFRGCSHDSLLPPLSPAVPLPPSLQTAPPDFPLDNSSLSHFLPPKAPTLPPVDFNVMEFDMDSELQSSRKRSMSDMNMSIFTDQDSNGLLEDLLAESCHEQNLIGLQIGNDTPHQQFHHLSLESNNIGFGDNSHPIISFSEGMNGNQNNIDSAMNQISSTDSEDLSKLLSFFSSGDSCKAQFSSEDQLNYTQQPEAGSWDNLPEFC